MAQDARPKTGAKKDGRDSQTLAGAVIDEADIQEDLEVEEELGSIDELLAETDQGWDIDAQVLTLKQAAGTRPLGEQSSTGTMRPKMPSKALQLPTPFELAPTTVRGEAARSGAIPTE